MASASTSSPAVFKLAPGIQSYAWGKKGSSSLSAQLAQTCIPDFKVDEGKTYAEVRRVAEPLCFVLCRLRRRRELDRR